MFWRVRVLTLTSAFSAISGFSPAYRRQALRASWRVRVLTLTSAFPPISGFSPAYRRQALRAYPVAGATRLDAPGAEAQEFFGSFSAGLKPRPANGATPAFRRP
jgi:hypothetical protein